MQTVVLTIRVPQDVVVYIKDLKVEGCTSVEQIAEKFVEDGALALRSLDEWADSEVPSFIGY